MSNETETTAGSENLATPLTDALFTEWQKHWKSEEHWGGYGGSCKPICWWEHARDLERQLAEAKADTERLDWLFDGQGIYGLPYDDHGAGPDYGEVTRQAIDKAMKEDSQCDVVDDWCLGKRSDSIRNLGTANEEDE